MERMVKGTLFVLLITSFQSEPRTRCPETGFSTHDEYGFIPPGGETLNEIYELRKDRREGTRDAD